MSKIVGSVRAVRHVKAVPTHDHPDSWRESGFLSAHLIDLKLF